MKTHCILITIVLLALSGAAGAQQSFVWTGQDQDPNNEWWYGFNSTSTTWPRVWSNNWGQQIFQYEGQDPPEHGNWDWPSGPDTATIGMEAELLTTSAALSSLNIGLGGQFLIHNHLQCTTLNIAGIVDITYDGVVFDCAIQNDGGTGVLRAADPFNNVLADAVLHDVIISVPVEIPNDKALALLGDIHLNDVISLIGTTGAAGLRINGDVTLTGNGWIETSDAAGNTITANAYNGQTFTNQSTIHAAGQLGYNRLSITNEGLIVADRTTMLTIDPEDVSGDGHPGLINTSTLRAADGGTLRLDRGVFDNTGGVIEALDASVIELHDWAVVAGGTLQTSGTGEIRATGASPKVRDLTVAAGSALVVPNGKTLLPEGTITVNGELRLESTGGLTKLVVRSPVVLDGAGEVVLSDANGNTFTADGLDSGHRLTSSIPIRGATGSTWNLTQNIALTNHSTITADGVNSLYIDPWDTPLDDFPGVVNTGILRAANGGALQLAGGAFDNTGGVIEALDGSLVKLGINAAITGGVLRTTGDGILRSTGGGYCATLSDLTVNGRVEALGTNQLRLGGTVVNNGVIEAENFVLPSGDLVLAGTGELRLVSGAQIRPDGAGVTNGSNHTIRASGAAVNYIHHALVHSGRLVVDSGAELRFQQSIDAQPGASIHVDGTLQYSGALVMPGLLTGSGTVNNAVQITGTGVLSPGSSTGTLTTGSLAIDNGATYQWQTSVTTGSDLVYVNGTLDMGAATLSVEISVTAGDDVPDRVVLFAYDTLASTPDTSQFTLPDGYTFTGVDTSGNELALTGADNPGLVFADDFETGNPDRWGTVQGSIQKTLLFEPGATWLNLELSAPASPIRGADQSPLVNGYDIQGAHVLTLDVRGGALRVGIRGSDGWHWSDWRTPSGPRLELQWRPGEIWLYDGHGLIAGAEGNADDVYLATVRIRSSRKLRVNPKPSSFLTILRRISWVRD